MHNATLEERVIELERRLARVLQNGVIEQADYDAARVRVRIGDRLSDWLPWATRRAGGDVDWWAPEVGEQVEVRAPNGEMREATVQPAYYSDAVPPPANSPEIRLIRFGNVTEIIHDRENNRLSIDTPNDVDLKIGGDVVQTIAGNVTETVEGSAAITVNGPATLDAPSNLTITAPLTTINGKLTVTELFTYQGGMAGSGGSGAAAKIDGKVEATGDVTAGGISTMTHTHRGDSGGNTGGPQ